MGRNSKILIISSTLRGVFACVAFNNYVFELKLDLKLRKGEGPKRQCAHSVSIFHCVSVCVCDYSSHDMQLELISTKFLLILISCC